VKHLSLPQEQLQNQTALMSHQIQAVKHRKCAVGLAGAHPGLQDRTLLNCTRIENAHKVRKNTFDFLLCIDVQQILAFLFPCWDIITYLNASVLTTGVFELLQQFNHATKIGNVANAVSACPYQP